MSGARSPPLPSSPWQPAQLAEKASFPEAGWFDFSCARANVEQRSAKSADEKRESASGSFEEFPRGDFRLVKVIKVACKTTICNPVRLYTM
jgi:hypothetical protein